MSMNGTPIGPNGRHRLMNFLFLFVVRMPHTHKHLSLAERKRLIYSLNNSANRFKTLSNNLLRNAKFSIQWKKKKRASGKRNTRWDGNGAAEPRWNTLRRNVGVCVNEIESNFLPRAVALFYPSLGRLFSLFTFAFSFHCRLFFFLRLFSSSLWRLATGAAACIPLSFTLFVLPFGLVAVR